MEKEQRIAQAGELCLNPSCKHFNQVDKGNIVRYGLSKQGRQRLKCKTCKKVFIGRKGTMFYRKQTSESVITDSIEAIATGSRLASVSRTTGKKPETIGKWVKESGQHGEQIEGVLLKGYKVGPSQVDGLWSYVKNKGEKK